MEDSVKVLMPVECKNCKHQNVIVLNVQAPKALNVFSQQDLLDAKADALLKVSSLPNSDGTIEWLSSNATVITPDDVENIVLNVQSQK
jgi:hypothetical protein